MGNYTTKLLGLVIMIKTMDKHLTEGVAGISQRLEKVRVSLSLRLSLSLSLSLRLFGQYHTYAS